MHPNKTTALTSLAAVMGFFGLLQAPGAGAATLSYEETVSGITGNGTGTDYSSLPVSDVFGNSLGPSKGTLGAPADPGFSFYDAYIFTVANSMVDAASIVLNEGPDLTINNLDMRLYSLAGNSKQPVLGDSPNGLVAGWSSEISDINEISYIPTTTLTGGTYVLEVRGTVDGTAGGSYAGLIDLRPVEPVPLPAALPLALSGLGLLGGLIRKRRLKQQSWGASAR